MARTAFSKVDLVVAVSKGQEERIRRTFPNAAPVQVVPNLVDTTRFTPTPLPPIGDGYHLLFVGLLDTDQKGLHILLDALALLKAHNDLGSIHLDIVGDGTLRPEYEAQAHAKGLEHIVSFLGIRTHDEIRRLLRESHALVLPSLHEALPLVIIEALASGRPVISTRCGGPEFMINVSNGMTVEPGQPIALADAIAQLLSHLSSYDPNTIAIEASKQYSREAVTTRITQVYEELLLHVHK